MFILQGDDSLLQVFLAFWRVCVFTFSENKTVYPVKRKKIDLFFRFSLGTRVKMPHYKTNGGEILLFYGEEGGSKWSFKAIFTVCNNFSLSKIKREHEKQLNTRQASNRHESKLRCQNIVTRKRSQNKHHPKQLPATRHQFFCQVYNSNDFPFPIIIGSSQPQLQCQSSSRVTYGSSLRHGPL